MKLIQSLTRYHGVPLLLSGMGMTLGYAPFNMWPLALVCLAYWVWAVREASGNFCARGRFGAHSSNESFSPVYYRRLVFIAFFNAGVRAVDIRDPLRPVEVAHFIPDGDPVTNNVEVDDRGYIYAVDRAGLGLHILELAGAARKIANWP